jgi:ring-1,2-phenylacetyl-CoA epoxidase subunit PaaE
MTRLSFHPLRVASVQPDTDEAVIVTFDCPERAERDLCLHPGSVPDAAPAHWDGEDLRRSYSICAGVDDATLRVGVRRVAGGRFSNWVQRELKAGDTIEVMPPQGRFFVPVEPGSRRHYLGLAGGSGITPILSIMKTVLAREPGSRFTLIYGNRRQASTMFKEELEDLKNRYLTRLVLHHVFSDEFTDVPLQSGVMNREKIGEFLNGLIDPASIDHAFVCGPYQMNDEAEAALRAAGLPAERIHIERFGVALPAGAPVGAVVHEARPGDAEQARVVIIRDGMRREIDFRKDQPSILDAASAAGLEVPFSCTSGVCGTCRCKVMEGEVRMERNFALDKAEVACGLCPGLSGASPYRARGAFLRRAVSNPRLCRRMLGAGVGVRRCIRYPAARLLTQPSWASSVSSRIRSSNLFSACSRCALVVKACTATASSALARRRAGACARRVGSAGRSKPSV